MLLENELKKLKTFDSIYFRGKVKTKVISSVGNGGSYVYFWKSKGLSDERINSIKTCDYGITPYLSYYDTNKIRVKFNGGCLKQDQATFPHGVIVNISIVYEITDNLNVSSNSTLGNCLFGAVKLTKNTDIDKYGYPGYEIGFDRHGSF